MGQKVNPNGFRQHRHAIDEIADRTIVISGLRRRERREQADGENARKQER